MTPPLFDPTLDRLFRHMAWANAHVLGKLAELSGEVLSLAAPNSNWSVGAIVEHYVRSAGFYASRLGASVADLDILLPSTPEEIIKYRTICAENDAQLRALGREAEGETTYFRDGRFITRARSTILGQSIYHATEHRTQIAGILVLHGITSIDLDEIDLWALGDAEGIGE